MTDSKAPGKPGAFALIIRYSWQLNIKGLFLNFGFSLYINTSCIMSNSFRKPDLTAPRFRPKVQSILTPEFLYKFRKKFSMHSELTLPDIRKVVERFNRVLWNTVIEERDGVDLPDFLGRIFISSYKMPHKNNIINYGESIKQGVPIKVQNLDTNGYMMKIYYNNWQSCYRFQHRNLWWFQPHRDFNRTASAEFKRDYIKYAEMDNRKVINARNKQFDRIQARQKNQGELPVTYNEFEFD